MNGHFQKFGKAYLVGTLFVIIQVFTAIVGEFGDLKPEELAKFTGFQWFIHWSEVIVSAGTVTLAFLNQSASKSQTPPTTTIPPP